MLAEAYIKAGGDTFYLCDIKDGQHEAVAEIVFNARGGGLSVNEFQDLPSLVKDMKSWTIFTVTRIRDGSIVAMVSYKRSPLVRSECPIYYSEYIVLIPEVRKIHLSRRIIEAVEHVYETLGYRGSLSRTATSATVPVINGILSKWYSTGVIPNSVYLPKLGWVEDLVFFSSKDSEKDKDIPMPEVKIKAQTFGSFMFISIHYFLLVSSLTFFHFYIVNFFNFIGFLIYSDFPDFPNQ